MTRDFFAFGELFNEGLPFPGWSFRMSGLEKWPIIKLIAKSASIEHGYSGKETRSWQFEEGAPKQMSFLVLELLQKILRIMSVHLGLVVTFRL